MSKRQFGSIRKLPSGRWQARYPDGLGRMVPAPTTYQSKADAGLFLAGVEADMARGTFIDPRGGRITFAEWSEQWLERPDKRLNSIVRDRQAVAVFLPELGSRPLASITPMHIQAAVDARSRVAAPATVARDFSALRAVFNAAVHADLLGRSPCRKAALPRVRPPHRVVLGPAELERLARAVPPRYRALILVAGVLGLRWGEAVGLRVRDVDFLRRTVTVAQTVEEVKGQLRLVTEAKTRSSLRTMAAPDFLIEVLANHLRSHRADVQGDPEALVFVGPRGGVLRHRFADRIFAPAVERAALDPSLTFHGLRHVAITAMVDAGVHPRVMQGRAGHATSKLTLELYAHVPESADRQAAKALEEYHRPPSSRVGTNEGEVAG
jgi:integrase